MLSAGFTREEVPNFLVPWTSSAGVGGRGWFHTYNLVPTHEHMELHVLTRCFHSPVPNRLQIGTSPQPKSLGTPAIEYLLQMIICAYGSLFHLM